MASKTKHDKRNIPQTEWIKQRLKDLGVTVADVARAMNTYPNMVWRMASGMRPATADEIMQWSLLLDVPPLEALRRFGVRVPSTSVPVAGILRANGRVSPVPGRAETVEAPADGSSLTRALRVETAQTSLGIWTGSILYYEMSETVRVDAFGRMSVLELGDHAAPVVGVLDRVKLGEGNVTVWGGGESFKSKQLVSASPITWQRAG